MTTLNHQEEDLKWALTTFGSAMQLENLVIPNYDLWNLVADFDTNMREWRHVQLSNFDVEKF